jgi:hypothetical protein
MKSSSSSSSDLPMFLIDADLLFHRTFDQSLVVNDDVKKVIAEARKLGRLYIVGGEELKLMETEIRTPPFRKMVGLSEDYVTVYYKGGGIQKFIHTRSEGKKVYMYRSRDDNPAFSITRLGISMGGENIRDTWDKYLFYSSIRSSSRPEKD